jgi:hypothetical protein
VTSAAVSYFFSIHVYGRLLAVGSADFVVVGFFRLFMVAE